MNFKDFLERNRYIVLDGAMGTELIRRGYRPDSRLWSAGAISDSPELVKTIHIEYIDAGADIITANTFRTDPWTFSKAGLSEESAREYLKRAIQISREAVVEAGVEDKVFVAGSVSPLEDCYSPELVPDYSTAYNFHRTTAFWLKEAGVDLILIETMNTLLEAVAASSAAVETGLPVIVSFVLRDDGKILSGDDIRIAYRELCSIGVDVFSVNCTHYSVVDKILESFLSVVQVPLCIYVNKGRYMHGRWEDDREFTPEKFSIVAESWYKRGVKIVGGCCFTNPEYIRAVSKVRDVLTEKGGER